MMDYESLISDIQHAAEEGVTMEEAEKIAAKALFVMNSLGEMRANSDRERRMRKKGLKAICSTVRLEEIQKHEKKPTEGALDDAVNLHKDAQHNQDLYDDSEVTLNEMDYKFDIAKEAHIYFRGVAKGRFE